MKTIRRNVFETNSSSMHAITVPQEITDWNILHEYAVKELSKFKVGVNKYVINLDVNDDNLEGENFSIRRYIPHYSFIDKAFYAIATIAQHYASMIAKNAPYDSSPYKMKWAEEEKDPKKKEVYFKEAEFAHATYLKKREDYIKKYSESNKVVLEKFEDAIKCLEDQMAHNLREYLNNRPQREDPDDWRKNEPWEEYMNSCPEVEVHIKYYKDTELNNFYITKDDDYFSTGCYDNEEFYYSVCRDSFRTVKWLVNPYAAVLAGSDEQGILDSYKQEEEANRLLEEAWKHAPKYETSYEDLTDEEIEQEIEEHCYTWDDSPRAQAQLKEEKAELRAFLKSHRGKKKPVRGNIIWPIGG